MMDWDAIGAIGEIVGATAVVLTLAYLATQIRQTRAIEKDRTSREMMDKGIEVMVFSSSNPGSLETLRRGIVDYSTLSTAEKDTFHRWATQLIVGTEQARQMHQSNLLPTESWVVWENFGVALIASSGGAQWWADYQKVFSQLVVEHLNRSATEKGSKHPTIYDLLPHWRE
jgi:hypothetical protein